MTNDRPLRVLHLTRHTAAGGLSRYVHDLCLAMHERGHDVRVAGGRGEWHGLFERAPFGFVEAPLDRGPVGLWRAARRLRAHLAEHPVDVIHSHYRRTTAVGRRLQSGGRPPLLYTVHLSDMPVTGVARWFAGDFGDHVHVASAESGRWAVEEAGVEPGRIALVPHGVQVERWPVADAAHRSAARRRFGVGEADRVAAFVGRLDAVKNVRWLLDVAERSVGAIPNLRVLVAGTGPEAAGLARTVAARGLAERVRLLGELGDPLGAYEAADGLLLPSQREGFSLVTAEAMSVGLAVCRTRTAGTGELVVEGVTGRSTPIEREAWVSAAVAFMADGAGLRAMGTRAARHVREQFTFERQLAGMISLYRRIAGLEASEPAVRTATRKVGAH